MANAGAAAGSLDIGAQFRGELIGIVARDLFGLGQAQPWRQQQVPRRGAAALGLLPAGLAALELGAYPQKGRGLPHCLPRRRPGGQDTLMGQTQGRHAARAAVAHQQPGLH